MALSADEVRHVAMLARLAVTDEEVAALAPELNAILGYAEQVGEVAADDVAPTVHPIPLENVLREDEPGEVLDRDVLLAQAPASEDDRIVVPRIVSPEGARPESPEGAQSESPEGAQSESPEGAQSESPEGARPEPAEE